MEVEDRLTVHIIGLEKLITDNILNKQSKNEIRILDMRVTKIEHKIGLK